MSNFDDGDKENEITCLDESESDLADVYDINLHEELLQRYNLIVLGKQNLIVIQPFQRVIKFLQDLKWKWCDSYSKSVFLFQHGNLGHKSSTNRDLMLLETLGLVETLGWTVVEKLFLGIDNLSKSGYFGSGVVLFIFNLNIFGF